MNEFIVKTPEEWKTGLYMRLEKSKKAVFRPIAVLAAGIAIIMCLSGTAFALSAVRAPEYFGSLFLGNSQTADEIYSAKNIAFESNRDDLSLTCKGIAGDSFDVFMLFELVSTGETVFSADNTYYFGEAQQEILFGFAVGGYSISTNFIVLDEKKAEIEICFAGLEGGSFVGKDIEMLFENIEYCKKDGTSASLSVIECEFGGKVRVDYASTLKKLKKNSDALVCGGVSYTPGKAEISNFNLDFKLKISEGKEIYETTEAERLVTGTLTLDFRDGTSRSFNIKMPPESKNDAFFSTIGKDDKELYLQIHFPEPVKASDVISVRINSVCLFTAE